MSCSYTMSSCFKSWKFHWKKPDPPPKKKTHCCFPLRPDKMQLFLIEMSIPLQDTEFSIFMFGQWNKVNGFACKKSHYLLNIFTNFTIVLFFMFGQWIKVNGFTCKKSHYFFVSFTLLNGLILLVGATRTFNLNNTKTYDSDLIFSQNKVKIVCVFQIKN